MKRFILLGCGTCRLDPSVAQTSACLVDGSVTYLFDIGFAALYRLSEIHAFENCLTLHIHISHRHTDHLIGLFPLLQAVTWGDDARLLQIREVHIHATQEVCELISAVRNVWGPEETQVSGVFPGQATRSLQLHPGPNHQHWQYQVGDIRIDSVHLPDSNNHGITFLLNGKRFGLTGDATIVDEGLISFCSSCDVCVFDFGHITNRLNQEKEFVIDPAPAVQLVSSCTTTTLIAAHTYLRNHQTTHLNPLQRSIELENLRALTERKAKELGFSGTLMLAKDLLDLLSV